MRAAFTLIELLVCIAVIALLLALLAPTLYGAWRAAQDVKCKAQVRSVGHGLSMYFNDFNRWFDNPSWVLDEHVNFTSIKNVKLKLDPYLDGLQTPAIGERTWPWVCPLDQFAFRKSGSSYFYAAGHLFVPAYNAATGQMTGTQMLEAPNYDRTPRKPVYGETGGNAEGQPQNNYYIDGSVIASADQ